MDSDKDVKNIDKNLMQIINEEYIDKWIKTDRNNKNIFDFFLNWSNGHLIRIYFMRDNLIYDNNDIFYDNINMAIKNDDYMAELFIDTSESIVCNECEKYICGYYNDEDYDNYYSYNNGEQIRNLDIEYYCTKCKEENESDKFYNIEFIEIDNIDMKQIIENYNLPFKLKSKEIKCNSYKCESTDCKYISLNESTYDLCTSCYNNLEDHIKKYFTKYIHTLPPKLKYELPQNVKPIEGDCTTYYKIYYEYNKIKYVFNYFNYCCNIYDKLFLDNITKDDIIKLIIDNISSKENTYDYLSNLWWHK